MCLWNILFFVTELTVYPIFLLNNKCFTMSLHILLNIIFSGYPIFHHLFNNFCVAQLCSTVWGPMAYSLLGSSVPGILQARILAWITIPFSRGSSQLRDQTCVSYIAGRFFTVQVTREAYTCICLQIYLQAYASILIMIIQLANIHKVMLYKHHLKWFVTCELI